jgi:nucleotide-binding universal stress UspA family protein
MNATTPGPIVVPLDGSSFAEVALPMGRRLAERMAGELHLVHVVTSPVPPPFHPEEQLALDDHVRSRSRGYLERTGAGLAGEGWLGVRTSLLGGESGVAEAIAEYARAQGASWIVLATHGAGGLSRWIQGSVADDLARMAQTPLFFLRPWDTTGELAREERPIRRILVPLDGSAEAEAALGPAAALAGSFAAALDLVRIVSPRAQSSDPHEGSLPTVGVEIDPEAAAYLEERLAPLRAGGLTAEAWPAAHHDVADGILSEATARKADLVVMSTHGRGGLTRAVIGSVADRVLKKGAVPLALVRPDARAPEEG